MGTLPIRPTPIRPTPRPTPTPAPASRPAPPQPLWREVLGPRLRAARLRRHRTLHDVARHAGISPQYLSEVERGLKDPSSEMLASICGALGVPLPELVREAVAATAAPRVLRLVGGARPGPAGPVGRPTGPVLLAA